MLGLGKHGPDGRYGAIVDIGSGSVAVAIVVSDTTKERPEIIWSHRERMVVHEEDGLDAAEKNITTTILNTILELGSNGSKALSAHDKHGKIKMMQVTISAPWSYTISKTISLSEENPFDVTPKLIKELVVKASEQAEEVLNEHDIAKKLQLDIIASTIINITANGYKVHNPYAKEVRKITLSQLTGVAQKRLTDAVRDGQEKVLAGAELEINTFMHAYYRALYDLHPDTTEICLIDITAEATELGIVRDGALKYVTHTPYGSHSIAREITKLCSIPPEEALGYMRDNDSDLSATLSVKKREALHAIIGAYETRLVELFHRTGDALSIPKTIFIHTDALTETFFSKRMKNATHKATSLTHAIHPITSQFFESEPGADSALLLSAYVFHKKLYDTTYLNE